MENRIPLRVAIRITALFGAVCVLTTVLVVARLAPKIVQTMEDVRSAMRDIADARMAWQTDGAGALPVIAVASDRALTSLDHARTMITSLSAFRWIPGGAAFVDGIHAGVAGAAEWARGTAELADAGVRVHAWYERNRARSPSALTTLERAEAVGIVGDALLHVRSARDHFDRGDELLARANCPAFLAARFSVCATLATLRAAPEIASLRKTLDSVVDIADQALALVGHRTPTSLLFLYLNNAELRPGGGFLGTYGLATIDRGSLTTFRTDDTYRLDRAVADHQRIPPPEPFRRYGIVPYWYLRDANWSPDFSTSSRTVLDFYAREGGSGDPGIVIGLTPTFIASLLDLVGPVMVEGVTFTAANIADQLEYLVERGYATSGIPEARRKDSIGPLSVAVIDRLLTIPFAEWRTIADRGTQGIAERQVMLFARDAKLQDLFVRFGVSGVVPPVAVGEDALLVVDANMGSLKTDPFVTRGIRYTIQPEGDEFRGRVELRYRNTAAFTWKTTRYRTYTRIYLPPGTMLLHAEGMMANDRTSERGDVDVTDELGRTVFGAFVSIEPGTEAQLVFEFRVSPEITARIRSGRYDFRVQKQLGALASGLMIDHAFPRTLRSAIPSERPAAWGDARYQIESDLRTDRSFTVRLAR